jgi:tripartite-type tricarboxylate transporter receptor subunit TctC
MPDNTVTAINTKRQEVLKMQRVATLPIMGFLMVVGSWPAQPQSYPAKPVRLVVPLAPGGGNDILARYVGKHLTDGLGQQVVIENRAGAGGMMGTEFVARAAPDGYTLLMGGSGQMVINPGFHRKYDPLRDFAPISLVGGFASLLVVHPSLPVKTVNDLIRLAKSRPGQINYASSGNASSGHLAMELFRTMAGINIVHIPYKGAGPALTDVMAGQVSLLFNNPVASIPYVKAGRLRGIAVTGTKRLIAIPDVPTVGESGLPGFDATNWLGLFAPAGTPRDIVARLNSEVVKILQRQDVQDWLAQQGFEPGGNTPEQFAAKIKSDTDKWAKVIRDSGTRLD